MLKLTFRGFNKLYSMHMILTDNVGKRKEGKTTGRVRRGKAERSGIQRRIHLNGRVADIMQEQRDHHNIEDARVEKRKVQVLVPATVASRSIETCRGGRAVSGFRNAAATCKRYAIASSRFY